MKAAGGARGSAAGMMRPLRAAARIAAAGFLAGIALSWRLWWTSGRLYPRAPVFSLRQPPILPEIVFLAILLASLALTAVGRAAVPRAMLAVVPATAVLVALDQSRLQPWVWEYGLMLAALGAAIGTPPPGQVPVLRACRSIVAALYFWSGVQKVNVVFVTRTWPELLGGIAGAGAPGRAAAHLGWVVPLVEVSIALALFVPRLRRVAVAGVVAMHACVLAVLVWTGENSVVWPWNAAMAALTLVLFRDRGTAPGRGTERSPAAGRPVVSAAVTLVAWLLPALSLVGLWDAYLAAALYAGNTIQAVVVLPKEAVDALPPSIRRNTWRESMPMFVDLNRWSFDELNVPAYPAERVMKSVGADVCRAYAGPGTGSLVILGRPDWRTGARDRTSFACADLR